MNKLTLYTPGYVDGKRESPIEFESTKDLLELTAVKRFKRGETLFRKSEELLMAVYDKGFEWWVIGTILNPEDVDLFEWEGAKKRAVK